MRHIVDEARTLRGEAHVLEKDPEGGEAEDKHDDCGDEAGQCQTKHLRLRGGDVKRDLHVRAVRLRAIGRHEEVLHHRIALFPSLGIDHRRGDVLVERTPLVVM